MAAGVTQPGGAGTTIYIYDDASSASGLGYTFAEIAAAGFADFVALGTFKPSYRALVNLQVGDTGTGTATTTLVDTAGSKVDWDSTKTLLYRTTQTSSWFTVLGTKVGTGNEASGHKGTTLVFGAATTIRGNFKNYGGTLRMGATVAAPLTFLLPTGGGGELVNCLMQSEAPSGNAFSFTGSAANSFDTIYNVDWTGATSGTLVNNWWSRASERLTFGGSNGRQFVPLTATAMEFKDVAFFGTPTTSDIAWNVGTIASHRIVRPIWSGNAPKFGFSTGTTNTPTLEFATNEMWIYDVKIVDRFGEGLGSIPVKLTDAVGNVQVDTLTASDGRITFGSGPTENAVTVMDHYSNGSAWVRRSRSPFTVQINTGPNAVSGYRGMEYLYRWPGDETITDTSGSFRDVTDIIPIEESAVRFDDLPLPGDSIERITAEVTAVAA